MNDFPDNAPVDVNMPDDAPVDRVPNRNIAPVAKQAIQVPVSAHSEFAQEYPISVPISKAIPTKTTEPQKPIPITDKYTRQINKKPILIVIGIVILLGIVITTVVIVTRPGVTNSGSSLGSSSVGSFTAITATVSTVTTSSSTTRATNSPGPQPTNAFPSGGYLRSCTPISFVDSVLTARCSNGSGGEGISTLDVRRCTVNEEIANLRGVLICFCIGC
jgi:hypothetical protein